MDSNKTLLIINPISGGINKDKLPELVLSRLAETDLDIEYEFTKAPGHAVDLAKNAISENYGSIIVAGGDGTVNEVAKTIRGSKVALAILPFGSGNGLARHINIPVDTLKALEVISKKHIERCDCGLANNQPFLCTFGLGFDAAVSESFSLSKHRGPINYVKSTIKELLTYKPQEYEIIFDDENISFKAFILTVCNASQYGNNAFIAPNASIRDGLLDITIAHDGNPFEMAIAGMGLFTGDLENNVIIQTIRVNEATIRKNSDIVHLDGEPMIMPGDVLIKCDPAAINLYTNPVKKPFKPFVTPLQYAMQDISLLLSRPFRMNNPLSQIQFPPKNQKN